MKSSWVWIFGLYFCFSASGAWAGEQSRVLDKRVIVYGGARIYQADGKFSSTKRGNPRVELGMDDLGLEKNEVSAIGGVMVNLGRRWNLRFDYFGYHDEAVKSAGKSFNFDRLTIPVNASVASSLAIDLYVLDAAYNLVHTDRARFGLGAGIHGIDFDLRISGRATVGGITVPVGDGEEDFLFPVPNIWAYGAYALTERIIFRYGAGWMSAGYGDYDGSLILANAALEYWPFEHMGFGAGRWMWIIIQATEPNPTMWTFRA